MMVNGPIPRDTAKDTYTSTKRTAIKEHGSMIRNKEKEYSWKDREIDMRARSKMDLKMARVNCTLKMEIHMKEIL